MHCTVSPEKFSWEKAPVAKLFVCAGENSRNSAQKKQGKKALPHFFPSQTQT